MRKSINAPSRKSKPQRTCVNCRQVSDKHDLIRLVAVTGGVELDVTGKKNGRGAYLCRSRKCWEAALKSGRLEHSLSTVIDREHKDLLVKAAEGFFSSAGSALTSKE
jgi:predicted RNA-binding protein YlxR (DUF448 family)